jgi:hypothetical protein
MSFSATCDRFEVSAQERRRRPYYFRLQTLRLFAGALARYRGVRQSPTWKKVEAFWDKFLGGEIWYRRFFGAR